MTLAGARRPARWDSWSFAAPMSCRAIGATRTPRQDAVLGQTIHAIVVASDPALTERDVIRHCARLLEEFMVPKSVEFRESLPKTDTGKVSRRLAAESLETI